jgi:hypothetical protein
LLHAYEDLDTLIREEESRPSVDPWKHCRELIEQWLDCTTSDEQARDSSIEELRAAIAADEASAQPSPPARKGEQVSDDNKCPECGTELIFGYGLAGGGMGAYRMCPSETCDYMDKTQDPECVPPEALAMSDPKPLDLAALAKLAEFPMEHPVQLGEMTTALLAVVEAQREALEAVTNEHRGDIASPTHDTAEPHTDAECEGWAKEFSDCRAFCAARAALALTTKEGT